MTVTKPLAHSANTQGKTHDLEEHLNEVANLASGFATMFGSEQYARCAGVWHDLGKNALDFQNKITIADDAHVEDDKVLGRVDHSSAGAIHAIEVLNRGLGLPLAFVIAGHHAGLANLTDLEVRLADPSKKQRLAVAKSNSAAVILSVAPPEPPKFLRSATGLTGQELKRRYEFWVRMLFSCLVDADWLDTEAHFETNRTVDRSRPRATIPKLLEQFNAHMSGFTAAEGTVNAIRRRVLADCRERGRACPQGVFTLCAPTGCGKTLAGMGFALEHAQAYGLKRVIVVIPYTSIIDQNAAVYRKVFGRDNVIDHHASLDPHKETARNRLAVENWDAPVVVTTSVQFVESLFANRTSKCRKLHSITNSVVIFDEVQTLPIPHLIPIVDVLKELVANYGVSLVLSTATQPALQFHRSGQSQTFPGFERLTEIVSEVPATFDALRRVDVQFDSVPLVAWDELAPDVLKEDEILVINHLRKDARELAERVPGSIHLSALMCPKHRLKVIDDIKLSLQANRDRRRSGESIQPVRVVATQLVEAGVDLDFPVVFRAFGGFDSIAQAAGRCNREGELRDKAGNPVRGRVRVFRAPTKPPRGTLRDAQVVAEAMLVNEPALDPLAPALFDPYFRRLYFGRQLDEAGLQGLREGWQFKTVAETFQMIDDDWSASVVVPYDDEAKSLLVSLRSSGSDAITRNVLRQLQQFTVTVPRALAESNNARQAFIPNLVGTLNAIAPEFESLYHPVFGLTLDGLLAYNPQNLMA
jgi:CRISPR-associated endonuclease/helicase Cas3